MNEVYDGTGAGSGLKQMASGLDAHTGQLKQDKDTSEIVSGSDVDSIEED